MVVLRSRLTGRLLRMIDDGHGPFTSWDGIAGRAVRKSEGGCGASAPPPPRSAARRAAATARGGRAGRLVTTARDTRRPRRALAPWHGKALTATDMLFWPEMYPYANRAELPSFHLSFVGGAVWYKWQPAADDDRASAVPAPGAVVPPAASADGELLRMLRRVAALVELPEVEAVAHTAALPKVPVQNPEPILAPATDPLHNDVAVPSPWSWRTIERPPAACAPLATRRSQLLLLARCERPRAGGFLGPVWRHYAPHRAALLAKSLPQLRVVLPDACTEATPPPSERSRCAGARLGAATAELRDELGGGSRIAPATEEEEDAIALGTAGCPPRRRWAAVGAAAANDAGFVVFKRSRRSPSTFTPSSCRGSTTSRSPPTSATCERASSGWRRGRGGGGHRPPRPGARRAPPRVGRSVLLVAAPHRPRAARGLRTAPRCGLPQAREYVV